MSQFSNLQNISDQDREMIRETEQMMGPEPSEMGFIKNLFWGRFQKELVLPYPQENSYEAETLSKLLQEVRAYMQHEHPAKEIDQNEAIPSWCLDRLFEMGVMGMTIPKEFGGLGLGVTSYNKVLEVIGAYCAATSVVVSAHQSIGCKALVLYGTDAQKKDFLPLMASQKLSAFCLSEPNVGCDANGQETTCFWNQEKGVYVLNGEKKWSTSGAIAGLFTVLARQTFADGTEGMTALIVTPDLDGVAVFERNRSKTGVRGTWQARIRFTNVEVPRQNLLHQEGKGLQVALSCLNYGRCTLSAGITGAAIRGMNQAIKWSQTRHQFKRPLADFELVQQKIARMSARAFAMDALLYLTTGLLDRKAPDIMVETAATKVFCSDMGNLILNDAMQIMGGEGYMTENELERAWRDARIYPIVEGANEVMLSFIYAYGNKQLASQLLSLKGCVFWQKKQKTFQNLKRVIPAFLKPAVWQIAVPLGTEVILGLRKKAPHIPTKHPELKPFATQLARLITEHSYHVKKVGFVQQEKIVTRQALQARLAENAIYLFALSACLSKMETLCNQAASGIEFERDWAAFTHFFDLAALHISQNTEALTENADESMYHAAKMAGQYVETLPHEQFVLPERMPVSIEKPQPPVIAFDAPTTSTESLVPAILTEPPTEDAQKAHEVGHHPILAKPEQTPASEIIWQTTALMTKHSPSKKNERNTKKAKVTHAVWQPSQHHFADNEPQPLSQGLLQPVLDTFLAPPKTNIATPSKTIAVSFTSQFLPKTDQQEAASENANANLNTEDHPLEWIDKPTPEILSSPVSPEWE